MSERYQGGYITATVVNPDGFIADSATATGVWTLQEQFTFHKASLWPSVMSRGVCFGGAYPGATNVIDFVTISTNDTSDNFREIS